MSSIDVMRSGFPTVKSVGLTSAVPEARLISEFPVTCSLHPLPTSSRDHANITSPYKSQGAYQDTI